jgi:hypothetical protein
VRGTWAIEKQVGLAGAGLGFFLGLPKGLMTALISALVGAVLPFFLLLSLTWFISRRANGSDSGAKPDAPHASHSANPPPMP